MAGAIELSGTGELERLAELSESMVGFWTLMRSLNEPPSRSTDC